MRLLRNMKMSSYKADWQAENYKKLSKKLSSPCKIMAKSKCSKLPDRNCTLNFQNKK